MCITRWPNVLISGDGLNPYFSAGIDSAAATMFLLKRVSCDFTVVLTGFAIGAELSCARVAVTASSATMSSNPVRFIGVLLRLQSARSILLRAWGKQAALR